MKITKKRTLCTEISGLTPSTMRNSGDIEEIQLSDDKESLISVGFTSQYIRDIIKNQVIQPTKKFKCISNSLSKLIDNNVITPVMFTNNDTYALLVEQFNVYQYEKRIMGFYDTEKNSIFLLLNNVAIGAAGSISNSDILSLIIHELMHYSFKNLKKDYQLIFDDYMTDFYTHYFNNYLYTKFPKEIIRSYVVALYDLEYTGTSTKMVDELNKLLTFAEKNNENNNLCYMNFKALEKLFMLLSKTPDNNTGVKIGNLSKRFFLEQMTASYQYIFEKMCPTLSKYHTNRDEQVNFKSVFYQEFIASSEVSAMIAGTLVRELYLQQQELDKDNPISKMINTISSI